MKISIFGTGYVGLVSGVCYAEIGHDVLCIDIDEEKINKLKLGKNIIHEKGLDILLKKNIEAGKIKFTTNIKDAIIYGDAIFSTVGTPVDIKDGYKADLSQIISVATSFGKYINNYKIFVNKSTVPVGTGDICNELIINEINKRGKKISFGIVSNPEFLREGSAIDDFLNPDRIVYGTSEKKALYLIREIYSSFKKKGFNIIETDIKSSELIKYVSNSYLAMKLGFINEIANFSEKIGANIDDITKGLGTDNRIGNLYLKPGIGYGGSCFSKDIKAFISFGKDYGFNFKILEDVENINEKQKNIIIDKLLKNIKDLKGKIISIWGLSYKEGTDDIRDAPSINIINELLKLSLKEIRVFDPVSNCNISGVFNGINNIIYCDDKYSALEKSNCLLLLTGWDEFRNIDYKIIINKMDDKIVLDGRNFFDKEVFIKNGFIYEGIGK